MRPLAATAWEPSALPSTGQIFSPYPSFKEDEALDMQPHGSMPMRHWDKVYLQIF